LVRGTEKQGSKFICFEVVTQIFVLKPVAQFSNGQLCCSVSFSVSSYFGFLL